MEEKKEEQTDKELHPERYDESLFNRAYKAGIKLRELNEQEKKKKLLSEAIGVIGLVLIFVLTFLYIKNNRSEEYLSPVVWDVEENPQVGIPGKLHLFKDLNIDISSESAIVFNPDSGQIYFAKDIDTRRQIASLTKLMTSMVVMDNMQLDDLVVVEDIPTYGEEEIWAIELEQGDEVTVENLLKMMLVSSYNDAAIVLAESLGSEQFISLMNEKALSLGLMDTHFSNPCGFDNTENYSTANDLRKIVTAFLNYPTLEEIVSGNAFNIEFVRYGEDIQKTIYTTNSLLENTNVKGIKTGYTEDAGRCLITLFEYEDNDERIVTVLLNAEDRYEETEELESEIINQL